MVILNVVNMKKNSIKPDKSVICPPFLYVTEGYDPSKLEKLNNKLWEDYYKAINKQKRRKK